MKCSAVSCDFEGTPEEVQDHRDGITRTAHWTNRASVIMAKAHGHMVEEPCEECGNMISIGRDEICSDHTWACSLHPSNVVRPPGVHHVEGGLGVDGKDGMKIDGKTLQEWGDCECIAPEPFDRWPGSHHQVNCPRYREQSQRQQD
jgi:hypothetical protein